MKLLHLILFICIGFTINAQNKLDIANSYFNDYAYYKALDLYLELDKKIENNSEIQERIGDCYYYNSNTIKSSKWYEKALSHSKIKKTSLIYKYIQSLKSVKKYDEAYKWLSIYNELNDIPNEEIKDKGDYLVLLEKLNKPISKYTKLINLELNTKNSEFGSFYKENELYYASTIIDSNKSGSKRKYVWNNEPFLALYKSKTKFTEDSVLTTKGLRLKGKNLNTKFHEANAIITKDGKTLYFTRDNLKKKNKLNPNKKGTVHLMIYKANLINNEWANLQPLSINDPNYSTGHPILSNDEQTLFFVSDRPGGFGATDLYKVSINNDGTYGIPKNLGSSINTEGREMFPFIDSENQFYFSSEAYTNLGLLDIFKSNYLTKKEDETVTVENLGAPFNSGYDDFSFFINPENKNGFFSSDRPDGKGSDDIYAFLTVNCEQKVFGVIADKTTKLPITNAIIRIIDDEGIVVKTTTTNAKGYYEFLNIQCEKNYVVAAIKENYKPKNEGITTSEKNDDAHEINMELTPLIVNDEIVINPIYFDFDKSSIRQDSYYELENIVNVLKNNPKMIIKIESHTDSRGGDDYNLKLSDRRAKSTRDYIISRISDISRIQSAIGFGETQLLNKCSNGVKCSEEAHQLNRRSKFIIIKRN